MNYKDVFDYHIAEATKLKDEVAEQLKYMNDIVKRASDKNDPIFLEEVAPGETYYSALVGHRANISLAIKNLESNLFAAMNVLK